MVTRRRFLETLAVGSLSASLVKSSDGGQTPKMKAIEKVVLYEGEYPGWPWITQGSDGTLDCVFREGTIHDYSSSGRILFTLSKDKGRSWSQAATILDTPNVDDRNTAIVEVSGQVLLVCFNTYTAAKESVTMVMQSTDRGKSWSIPIPTGTPNSRTRSAMFALKNGNSAAALLHRSR